MKKSLGCIALVLLGCGDGGRSGDGETAGSGGTVAGSPSGGNAGTAGEGTGGTTTSSGGDAGGGRGGTSGGGSAGKAASGGRAQSGSGGLGNAGSTANGGGGNVGSRTDVRVTVMPRSTTLLVDQSIQLTATVSNASDDGVTWSVVQEDGCGSVTSSGRYTAPSTVPSSPCQVRATSNEDPRAFGTATIAIAESGGDDEPGVWKQLAIPVDYSDPDGGGAQTVLVDPVRPSDFYAFVTPNNGAKIAVLKSTDYGKTWTDVNTTKEMTGNPWGAAIDPNPHRDPNTPPTLYSPAGYGAMGVWKSVDGGVTWENLLDGKTPFDPYNPYCCVDAYGITILPDDPPNHVLFTYHYSFKGMDDGGFGESRDGGKTWTVHPPPPGIGTSHYLIGVDEDTWISIAQMNEGRNGMWKTDTAGRVNGEISVDAWRKVDDHEHLHGSFAAYIDPRNGYIYAPGIGGIKRSADEGETWETVYREDASNVVATDRFLYGSYHYGPRLIRAPRDTGKNWMSYTEEPPAMEQAAPPYGAATSFDGEHWIIVMAADSHGLWRYVEPK